MSQKHLTTEFCRLQYKTGICETISWLAVSVLQFAGIDLRVPELSSLKGQKRPASDVELNALADILSVYVD